MGRIIKRFREFGGWRLVVAYARMGVLPTAIRQGWRLLRGKTTKEDAYSAIIDKVSPRLAEQYRPLMLQLKEYYDKQELAHEHADIVWTCWLQGLEQAPRLVKACVESMKTHLKDKEVRVVTYDNYQEYVTLPDYVVRKYEKGIIPAALFTDMLRLKLLTTYGGTWMDATVLCTGDNYPKNVMHCDLFLFQQYQRGVEGPVGISNWFITACTNNPVLLVLRDLLFQYWRDYNCTVQYFIFHGFFSQLARLYPREVAAMPRGNRWWALLLDQRLTDTFDPQWMKKLTDTCCFHKLNYRKEEEALKKADSFYARICGGMRKIGGCL